MLASPDLIHPVDALEARPGVGEPRGWRFERLMRRAPIRWRILFIALFNSAVALVLLALIWNGAAVLGDAWSDLRRVRQSERFLGSLDSDAERLQSLIHRYFAQPDADVHARIIELRETLISRLRVQARLDPLIAASTLPLTEITERFINGFDDLREVRERISLTYEMRVLGPSRQMAGLYGLLAGTAGEPPPPLAASRDNYNAMILAANAFYLSGDAASATDSKARARAVKQTMPVIRAAFPDDDVRRAAATGLAERADTIEGAVGDLQSEFALQAKLLRESIDDNAAAMSAATDRMMTGIRDLELSAQSRFDRTLQDVAVKLGLLALAFVALVVLIGVAIARSISEPLGDIRLAMSAIASGDYSRRVGGLGAADEIGEMARAVEVFRENAVARRRAEQDLLLAKESAEAAFADLRDAQTNLIQAEKFAALGGLVAGVAHEVNNPVGISITVASSLAGRCDDFAAEIADGQLRRSRLEEFVSGVRVAARQLVANLGRAGDLVQSFKQVAVDRSHAERRAFDLREVVEQIFASLRPMLKTTGAALSVEVPDGITMVSYPGPLGQIVTNLFLNALLHGYDGRPGGTISVSARPRAPDQVEIVFRDDGRGMSENVQRQAFDPFFTTRRGSGGTGLGLHIVYNLVTARLGGRVTLTSSPGLGSTFLLVLPIVAPDEAGRAGPGDAAADHG